MGIIQKFSFYYRQRYRSYKDLYSRYLLSPADEALQKALKAAETDLDAQNIVTARTEAKVEVLAPPPTEVKMCVCTCI